MKYAMLVYMNLEAFGALPKEEQDRIHAECGEWHEDLMRNGKSTGAIGLHPPFTATSIRMKGGQFVITDGPFVETKEVLGGLERLECRDLDEAIAIAKRFPTFRGGCTVELRPESSGPEECRSWDDGPPK
jgi:hypothetical protein